MSLADRKAALKQESNDVYVTGTDFRAKSSQIHLVDRYWAIDGDYAANALAELNALDVEKCRELNAEFLAAQDAEEKANPRGYEVLGNVALLSIDGPMTKKMTSASYLFGGTSTEKVRAALRSALDDPTVASILVHVESPGGQVSGTAELADDLREAGQKKNVVAYIEDLGASAAYWVASQATTVMANRSAAVGSIGVFMTVVDSSEAASRAGVKVNLVSTGKYKGAGQPGVKITDVQLENFQKNVEAVFGDFKAAIATGRAMSDKDVAAVADGRVFKADAALALGLIDTVCSFEECLATVSSLPGLRQPAKAAQPASAAPRSAKEPQMSKLTDLLARVPGLQKAFADAGVDPSTIEADHDASDVSQIKARMAQMEAANLAQLATAHWNDLIKPDGEGRAFATWAERDSIIETFKALALMDGGGKLQFSATDGSFVVGPNLKRFMDGNFARSKNSLQAQMIPDADPTTGAVQGLRTGLMEASLRRVQNNGRLSKATVDKIIGGNN